MEEKVQIVECSKIKPNKFSSHREFDESELRELADSIKSFGILVPLIAMRDEDDHYELIAGERKLLAAKMAGLTEVPVIIKSYDDADAKRNFERIAITQSHRAEDRIGRKEIISHLEININELLEKANSSQSHFSQHMFMDLVDEIVRFSNLLKESDLDDEQAFSAWSGLKGLVIVKTNRIRQSIEERISRLPIGEDASELHEILILIESIDRVFVIDMADRNYISECQCYRTDLYELEQLMKQNYEEFDVYLRME